MKIENTEKVDMEISKAIDELIDQHLPALKKSGKAEDEKKEDEAKAKGKAEDEEKKENEMKSKGKADGEEDEAKAKGKAEDEEEGEEKAYYSKKSMTLTPKGIELLNKAIAAEQATQAKQVETIQKSVGSDDGSKFQKSVVQALSDLQQQIQAIAKRPVGFRKSVTTDVEAVQKSKEAAGETKLTVGEVMETLQDLVQKGKISSNIVCEFNATQTISDPMIKSQVIAETRNRKGLK